MYPPDTYIYPPDIFGIVLRGICQKSLSIHVYTYRVYTRYGSAIVWPKAPLTELSYACVCTYQARAMAPRLTPPPPPPLPCPPPKTSLTECRQPYSPPLSRFAHTLKTRLVLRVGAKRHYMLVLVQLLPLLPLANAALSISTLRWLHLPWLHLLWAYRIY